MFNENAPSNKLWDVGIKPFAPGGIRIKYTKEQREEARKALSGKPRHWAKREDAQRFYDRMPEDVKAMCEVFEFIYL